MTKIIELAHQLGIEIAKSDEIKNGKHNYIGKESGCLHQQCFQEHQLFAFGCHAAMNVCHNKHTKICGQHGGSTHDLHIAEQQTWKFREP